MKPKCNYHFFLALLIVFSFIACKSGDKKAEEKQQQTMQLLHPQKKQLLL